MSCNNCNCLDCARNRAIAKAKNHMNDMGDLEAPIQRPRWQDAEPANDVQAMAWGIIADHVLARNKAMPLMHLADAVCDGIMGLKPRNRPRVRAQVERFLRESDKYRTMTRDQIQEAIRAKEAKSKDLGHCLNELRKLDDGNFDPYQYAGYTKASTTIVDNYTCKGCGNTKCSVQEKSCWKCGRAVGT